MAHTKEWLDHVKHWHHVFGLPLPSTFPKDDVKQMMLDALLDALPYVEDVLSNPDQLRCFKPGTVQAHARAIREAIKAATIE